MIQLILSPKIENQRSSHCPSVRPVEGKLTICFTGSSSLEQYQENIASEV